MYIKASRAFVNPLNKISTLTPGEKQDKNICLCNHLAIHLSFLLFGACVELLLSNFLALVQPICIVASTRSIKCRAGEKRTASRVHRRFQQHFWLVDKAEIVDGHLRQMAPQKCSG